MRSVLITGAAGGVGGRLRKLMKGMYPDLRLSDLKTPTDLGADETFIAADLTDPAAVARMVEGVEGIVHLGGVSVEAPWEAILSANIIGLHNLFEAARKTKVKRIVFASSNHAVGFYPRRRKIGTGQPVRPDSRYGVSKAFGEALGAFYAYKHGIGVTALRIGNVDDAPVDKRRLAIWLKPEDLVQLIRIGLEHPDIRYEVMYGASDNETVWWDNERAFQLGYRPVGRGEDSRGAAMAAQAKLPADPVGNWYQGGTFCSAEYDSPLPLAED